MVCKSPPSADHPSTEPVVTASHEGGSPGHIIVSKEVYDSTLAEVRLFVEKLNLVIKNKDYAGWRNALSDEFFARISSPEFLEKASQSALLRSKKIVLKTPNDYFLYVVVPARSNSSVDEIEFIAANAVKVFYIEKSEKVNEVTEVRRLRLYELIKKSGDTWKITD
jgi:hypothetical protein